MSDSSIELSSGACHACCSRQLPGNRALRQAGWQPVVVERAPERRKGGYFVGRLKQQMFVRFTCTARERRAAKTRAAEGSMS